MRRRLVTTSQATTVPTTGTPITGVGPHTTWPVRRERPVLRWFPAGHRLIGLVRASRDSFVLPPAVVRKAAWRE